ncbi:MAG: NUDIX hydrolase [Rhodospirillales bacterium]|jgi:ADP-ribose pyrophosphatase|nr:NUDIX hydrolase [Rhodospirillales bacterium]MBT4006541.1 NUDIX hydrolase [Rhodospirillales bacterium]MBT5077210.1 NUDIX hydrolase [Rhodospirillales bacterium]MBT5113819.1 NUDIX hydrolase [Rhodospirillales bacterium]MBT5672347.1 NUDIX hydrolase [Rhodospirillales bacterium]
MSDQGSDSEKPAKKSAPNPVRLLNRDIGCQNSKWNVYLDHISDDHGNEVRDFIVLGGQVRRDDLIGGVCILPILDGAIGLQQYFRHAVAETLWEVPRGFIDEGETPVEAALRELKEETGLSCDLGDVVSLGFYLPEPSTIGVRGAVFAAPSCRLGEAQGDPEIGLGGVSYFSIDEVSDMAHTSKIQDAATLIAFYRYVDWCQRSR